MVLSVPKPVPAPFETHPTSGTHERHEKRRLTSARPLTYSPSIQVKHHFFTSALFCPFSLSLSKNAHSKLLPDARSKKCLLSDHYVPGTVGHKMNG